MKGLFTETNAIFKFLAHQLLEDEATVERLLLISRGLTRISKGSLGHPRRSKPGYPIINFTRIETRVTVNNRFQIVTVDQTNC